MAELMAKMLVDQTARSQEQAEKLAIEQAAEPLMYWMN